MLLLSCLLGLSLALKSIDVYIYTSERSSKGLSNKGSDIVITKEPMMYHIERDKNMYYIKGANNNYLTLTKDHIHYSIDKSDWILRKNINLSDQTGINHYQLENSSKCLARYDDLLSAEKCDIMSEKQMFFFVSPSNNVNPEDVAKFLGGTIDTKIKPVNKTVIKEADSDEEADMYRFMIKKNTVTLTKTMMVKEVPTYVDPADSSKDDTGLSGQLNGGGKKGAAKKSIGLGSFGEDSGYDSSAEFESKHAVPLAVASSKGLVDGKDGYYSSMFIPSTKREGTFSSIHPVHGGKSGTSTVDSSDSSIATESDDKEPHRGKKSIPRHESESSSSDTDDSGIHHRDRGSASEHRGRHAEDDDSRVHHRDRGSASERRTGHAEDDDSRVHHRDRGSASERRTGHAEDDDSRVHHRDRGSASEHRGRTGRTRESESNDYHTRSGRNIAQDDSIDIARRDPTGIVSDDGSSSRNRGLIPGLIADMNQTKPEKDEVDMAFKNLKREAGRDKTGLEPKVTVAARTGNISGDKIKGFRMRDMNNENLQLTTTTQMVPVSRGSRSQATIGLNSNYPSNPYLPQNGMLPQGYPPYLQNRMNQNQQEVNRPSF